ncbi:MAG: hypothetical protein N2037_11155 [Acidimicrobiales bacterium]|nr:hypothetical protein [Acidimicrobiales bacterium]
MKVTLKEWSVTPEQSTIPAGKINIFADNQGDEPHEIVIVRADDPKTLPTIKDGGMDEEALGEDKIVGEIEAFPAKSTCNGVFDLTPGTYVLLCNVVEKEANGEIHDHFFFGMAATITVA